MSSFSSSLCSFIYTWLDHDSYSPLLQTPGNRRLMALPGLNPAMSIL
uniref:Uncharacterized protein n=1 Tax=Anguilla anguilla TaxID=7936 RepID=A0A0E9SZ99_ANGAN